MRLKAELWDKIQYLFRNYYDRMMHGVFYLDGNLNRDKFTEAVRIMLNRVPVLRSKYVAGAIDSYWEVSGKDLINEALIFTKSKNLERDIDKFITSTFDYDKAPQLRIKVINNDGKDTIAVLINHQCFDGADFKQFMYKLAEVYNDLISGGNGDIIVKSGTRSNSQVYQSMSNEDRKTAMSMYKNISKTKDEIAFPFTSEKTHVKPMIIKHKLSAEIFNKIKEYGNKYDSTINDIILAAYFRALYHLVNLGENQRITIPCMTDLRRHIEGGDTKGFTNLTCLIPCTIDSVGPTYDATLKKVHGEMQRYKNDKFAGLGGIPLLELAYKVAPVFLAEIMIKIGYSNPLIGMSNIGIVNEMTFGKEKVYEAFMTGAIKYKPYMQLAFMSYRKAITLSICIYGTEGDRAIIEKFFRLFDVEIKSIL